MRSATRCFLQVTARPERPVMVVGMKMCNFSELDEESCSHCLSKETPRLSSIEEDPLWERHDYVDVFSKQDPMDERRPGGHAFNPTAELLTDGSDVKVSDIHGRHEAIRLQRRRQ